MNTLSYVRVSAEQIPEGHTCLERQKEIIKTLCNEAGATIIGEFEDIGSSNKKDRPGLAALYAYLQNNPGKIQAIAVSAYDRLFRNYPAYYEFSQWIEELGIQLIVAQGIPLPMLFLTPDRKQKTRRRKEI